MAEEQQITVPNLRKYRTELPNLIDDMGLSPYEFRLLAHYYRVGDCYEATTTTAEKCKMSTGQVSKARRELAKKGLIVIDEVKRKSLSIRVVDIWDRNFAHFSEKSRSHHERYHSPHERERSPGETKKELIKNKKHSPYLAEETPAWLTNEIMARARENS